MRVNGRLFKFLTCTVLLAAPLISIIASQSAAAAQFTNRSMTLVAGTTDGGSMPGGVVTHQFNFTTASTADIGSIKFEYCTTASGDCTVPTGLVTTTATLGSETGATGFSTLVNTTNGAPYIARASASSVNTGTAVSYQLRTVTNPTATNQAFYVRISTYGSLDVTGTAIDTGTVAASTANQIILTGIMPESLIFCTGKTITVNGGGIPDCTTATEGSVQFDQLFSPTDTATAKSQMSASTNATNGYSITVSGPTMTSGSNTIAAMSTAEAGIRGKSQFGMNLKLNTTATSTIAAGAEIAPASNGTDLRGQAATGYDAVDTFKFGSGDIIAKSDFGGAGATNAQIYTTTYIVNVSGSQAAGTYTTTLTYICTAVF